MATKLSELKNGMINVTIEGTVRRKSALLEAKNGSKYFTFYLHNAENESLRIAAFKDAAVKLFDQFTDNRSYRIEKVTVRENTFQNVTELQVALTTAVAVTSIPDILSTITYTPLSTLKEYKKPTVDIIGRIVEFNMGESVLKDGTVKSITIVTLRDETVYIDVNFWDNFESITKIPSEDLASTIVSIQGASVNTYQNALSLNDGKTTMVEVNPVHEEADKLRDLDDDTTSLNLSQRSDPEPKSHNYSNTEIISAIKREIASIEEKEERLKIRKILLNNELFIYSSK